MRRPGAALQRGLLLVLVLVLASAPRGNSGHFVWPRPLHAAEHARSLHADAGGAACLQHSWSSTGPGYQWMVNETVRHSALTNPGNRARLRAAMSRYLQQKPGENLTVVFVGGSIAAGQGAVGDGMGFPFWTEHILNKTLGPGIHMHNGAVPGTLSVYMSVCHNVHVPKEADIIFVEYTVNDISTNPFDSMSDPIRRPFERLLRKLLLYPR